MVVLLKTGTADLFATDFSQMCESKYINQWESLKFVTKK